MSNATNEAPVSFALPFHNIRHISSPEDLDNNRKVYSGHVPVSSVVELPTDENVRDYLVEAEGKKRRRPNQVHRAIEATLRENPHNFSVLNSGIVLVAKECEVDEKNKCLKLIKPSIINGSQTQGVIKDFINGLFDENDKRLAPNVHVKFELIVTSDEDLIAETSIARNFQNDVMTISIAGRKGQLDELEKSFKKRKPYVKLQKSETKLSDDYVKTEKLLQVITALIPEELWPFGGDFNKVYTYSMKTKCLKQFQEVFEKAREINDPDHEKFKNAYKFYLDIVADADEIYHRWKCHQGFAGTGLRKIKRGEKGEIQDVPDGLIFPIISSLSAFATETDGVWRISPPSFFSEDDLIQSAKTAYQEIAHSNPWNMGKSKACYSQLYQFTLIHKKLSDLS